MSRRAIPLFFLKVAVIYGLFLLPFLHGDELYAAAFRKVGSVAFRQFGGAGRVHFDPMEPRKPPYDTTATITNLRLPRTGRFDVDTRNMGYLATAFAFALIVSSPVPWQRRTLAAFLGLAIMSAFVWLQMYVRLANAFADPGIGPMINLSPFWKRVLDIAITVLSRNPVTAYVTPVIVWAALTIRRVDLVRLGIVPEGDQPAAPQPRKRLSRAKS